jgi:hypothetical protein
LKPSDLPGALGEVRALAKRYLSGTPDAFDATRELLNLLLRITVMDDREHLRFVSIPDRQRENTRVIGVRWKPIPLNDDNYLRLMVSLRLDPVEDGHGVLPVPTGSGWRGMGVAI